MRFVLALLLTIGVIAAPELIRTLPNGFPPAREKSESLEDIFARALNKIDTFLKDGPKAASANTKILRTVSTGSGASGKLPAPPVKVSVISLSSANDLFRQFQQNRDIPFRYPRDGCYARATEMSRMAEKAGITMGRIYVDGKLQVKTDLPSYSTVQWKWHVAPIAYVTQPNGETDIMVFDPGLFNRPVTQREWLEKLQYSTPAFTTRISNVYYGNQYQLFERKWETVRTGWDRDQLRITGDVLKRYSRLQDQEPGTAARSANGKRGIN